MSQQKDNTWENQGTVENQEYSIITNPDISKDERLSVVKSIIQRLNLTTDDIQNPSDCIRLNTLKIIPPDLLPFDAYLTNGHKVTFLETDPVVTLYHGEFANIKGDILHLMLRNEGEELSEDFMPSKRLCNVTGENLDQVLPPFIQDIMNKFSVFPNLSDKPTSAINQKVNEMSKEKRKIPTNKPHNSPQSTETEMDLKRNDDNSKVVSQKKNDKTSPLSSKFQVIGLIDIGEINDSDSEEGLHNTVEELSRKGTAITVVDKELSNPHSLKKSFAINKVVRKSARAHKPNVRYSSYQSWDDLKIRLPKYRRKDRKSKCKNLTKK